MHSVWRKNLSYIFSIAAKVLFFHYFHGGASLGLPVGMALFVPEETLRNVFYVDVNNRHCSGCGVVDDCAEHHERLRYAHCREADSNQRRN